MKPRKFILSDAFIEPYKTREVPWGPLGYITYKRTYARRLDEQYPGLEGTEEWYQTCRRVIEGMFSIQKKHIQSLGLDWNDQKAQRTAKEAYERMFVMKWLPPGRGLWMMGSDFVEERTQAGLFNCAFRTTKDLNTKGGYVFAWMMDALMLGIGVGFDTLGANTITIKHPSSVSLPANYLQDHIGRDGLALTQLPDSFLIHDSREGWVQSVEVLLDSFIYGYPIPKFDYSALRGAGQPIKGFGGISSGPEPLRLLHTELIDLYMPLAGIPIKSTTIVDTENLIGKCVVSGNVRRSAALSLGDPNDKEYVLMKQDQEALYHHRWGSNNSINASIGMDYTFFAEQSATNGEPGYIWLENARNYGRMKDGPNTTDLLVCGFNPCGEIQLESEELCNVPETFPAIHTDLNDYIETVKIAYLYGKTVTLTRTHWKETNAKMQKNRRVGLSQSGIAQAINKHGLRTTLTWSDKAYDTIKKFDQKYSDWFCVPRSKRLTSVKPSGSVSLLNGSTAGIHYPEDEFYIRRIRFAETSELLPPLRTAGYHVEACEYSPHTVVVSFPVHEQYFVKGKRDVSMWEQLELAALYQYYWADNSVSVTVTFKPDEAKDIKRALELYETRLKDVSFLRYQETGYRQAPYEPITKEHFEDLNSRIVPVTKIEQQQQGSGTSYCDSTSCSIFYPESGVG